MRVWLWIFGAGSLALIAMALGHALVSPSARTVVAEGKGSEFRAPPISRAALKTIRSPTDVADANLESLSATEFDSSISALRLVLANGDIDQRAEAAIALGDVGNLRVIPWLYQALTDHDTGVREAAIVALAEIGGDDAARALAVALDAADPRIRESAVDALGDIGGVTAVALLQRALSDPEGFVRIAAADALEQLNQAPQ